MRSVYRNVWILVLFASLVAWAASAAEVLPFGVSMGGQTAVVQSSSPESPKYAVLSAPVTADAKIVINDDSQMVIINVFPCDDIGNPVDGVQPAVLLLQGRTVGKLNETMDKKPLPPGTYIANIVSNSRTARVLFEIK